MDISYAETAERLNESSNPTVNSDLKRRHRTMRKHNPINERIKRKYFTFLKEAKRYSEPTVDTAAKALSRFESYTSYRDFKAFHFEQAVAFKKQLAEQKGQKSGDNLSKATLHSTLTQLKRFFQWLALQPGYKSRIQYADAEYFNLSDKDTRIATQSVNKDFLQWNKSNTSSIPCRRTEMERRNRALVAFTLLTGARDSAIASLKLKHMDLISGCVNQDARDVNTKFSKTFNTFFFPVGEEIRSIVSEWVLFLRDEKLWGNEDPLFPATRIALDDNRQFQATGLSRKHWSNATPIRKIFHEAFERAGLPYFNPHSFRNTLVQLGEEVCKTPEQFKAWSQNLGHEKVLTTFISYGVVTCQRQGEIIHDLATPQRPVPTNADEIAEAVFQKLRSSGMDPK